MSPVRGVVADLDLTDDVWGRSLAAFAAWANDFAPSPLPFAFPFPFLVFLTTVNPSFSIVASSRSWVSVEVVVGAAVPDCCCSVRGFGYCAWGHRVAISFFRTFSSLRIAGRER